MTSKNLRISALFACLVAVAAASDARAQDHRDPRAGATTNDATRPAIAAAIRAHMQAYKAGNGRAMLAVWEGDGVWRTTTNGCCSSTVRDQPIAEFAGRAQAHDSPLTYEIETLAVRGDEADVRVAVHANGGTAIWTLLLHRGSQNRWRIRQLNY